MVEVHNPDQSGQSGRTPLRVIVQSRLDQLGIRPHEALGQHFLVNDSALDTLTSNITPGGKIIEVGSGIGQVTDAIAIIAGQTIGIEIDRRFSPVLDQISETHDNVEIVYQDALTFPWDKHNPKKKSSDGRLQIVASLPYHISEPFMRRLVSLNIDNAVLVLGAKLIDEVMAQTPDSTHFGTLSLLAQTFFTTEPLANLGRQDFFPPPRTESGILKFTPREVEHDALSRRDHVFRALFLSERRNPSLASVLKDALIEFDNGSTERTGNKREVLRKSRRQNKFQLRQLVEEYKTDDRTETHREGANERLLRGQQRIMDVIREKCVTEAMLHKPFRLLNNTEMRQLAKALS